MRWRRFRKWAKWACTVAAIMILLAWGPSGCIGVEFLSGPGCFGVRIGQGQLVVQGVAVVGSDLGVFDLRGKRGGWKWWFDLKTGRWFVIAVPLWAPFAMVVVPAALGWRGWLERRRWAGLPSTCPDCGYSRRGLAADAKCPECGTTPTRG